MLVTSISISVADLSTSFRQLCTGEHNGVSYAKAPLHRVIDEFMIQGGDVEKGDGTGRVSIYGGEFEDENLGWRDMAARGLVCSASRGPDTNSSQYAHFIRSMGWRISLIDLRTDSSSHWCLAIT